MPTQITIPTLGESVTEATVGKWFKAVGDPIAIDEPVVELETDKVTIDVPAPVAGTLGEIAVKEGETVGVGAILGTIVEGAAKGVAQTGTGTPPAQTPAAASAAVTTPASGPAETASTQASAMPPSPAAAKLLAETDLAADQVTGSGRRGQVLKGDVLDALDALARAATSSPAETPISEAPTTVVPPTAPPPTAPRPASPPQDASREERVRLTRLRLTIAQRLTETQATAAMLTTFNEVDMRAVMDLRARYRDVFERKHGVKLGFMGIFTKAVTHVLKEVPEVNAEIDGTDIVYKDYAHIGVAVATDKGLVVPVVRDADTLSIAQIEQEIGRLGTAARDGTLTLADLQGGTFTISNGGVYGSLMSTPILNAPQSGILGMHKIQERPVAIDGQVVIRPMMYLALTYDHRLVDGKGAVTFLVRVKEILEDPGRLVLDL